MLPMPWPTSSLFGLWRVRVIASATREVSRLSMEPSRAMINAGWTDCNSTSTEISGSCSSGRPMGTSPMTGVPVNHRTPRAVPAARAARVGGMYFLRRSGQRMPTARVTTAMASALKLTLRIASGHACTAAIGPPVGTEAPRNGSVWSSMMMIPMPDMNPDMTEYGVKATKRPTLITPRSTWISPAMMTIVNALARLSACVATITATAMAIGPVGPEIWERVPPNTAAKKPTAIAPYMPASAPSPEATPKASATGNPTTAAVTPPKRSPRKVWRS